MKGKRIAICLGFFVLLIFTLGCSKKAQEDTVFIGSKPQTEQYILTEMMKMLIEEHSDLKVILTKGIAGGVSNIMPALAKGDLDMYPEYTGTSWEFVLKQTKRLDSAEMFRELNKQYAEKYKLAWVNLFGFGNTYRIAVPKKFAEENKIKTMSDLVPFADQLVFGAEYDFFEREDGYPSMIETYGYTFKDNAEMDIGLRYQAIADGQIQVVDIFTTDGKLLTANLTVLEDDKQFFPDYECGIVIRQATLEKYPYLEDILLKMNHLISEQDMIAMNYEVEVNKRDEKAVAREFLQKKRVLDGGAPQG